MSQSDFAIPDALKTQLENVLEMADRQVRRTIEKWPASNPAPIYTENGKWYRQPTMWTDWTPGFYAGQMWILAQTTGDGYWRAQAEEYTRALELRRFDRDVHDLGFIFLSSYKRWLDVLDEDDPLAKRIGDTLVTAATVQSYRWNGRGDRGYIYSFNGPQSLFIDVMMNVRLLFWAATRGAPPEVGEKALEHSRTSAHFLVQRDGEGMGMVDGSTTHEAIFNTEDGRGEFRCLSTQQGYSPFTCWSRGLAWALYGFAEAYRYTGEKEFLEVSRRCAKFYLDNTPESGVPLWDYGAPAEPHQPLDSSAAAVAAGGLLSLLEWVDESEAEAYRATILRVAESLTSDEFQGAKHDGQEGVLLHGTYHKPRNWGVDASVMWGEFFFLELVERLLRS
ncbi:MAG: glucuronyl hydrolase [Planctomycetota bacterium]